MACTLPPLDQLTNSQQFITQSELLTLAAGTGAAELSTALGIALIIDVELTPTPLAPFVWAATAIAVAVQEILGLFSGGRPKDQDTNSVIWAYHMSGYWPLQALGSNLAMALKNGAPISDSRPQIQAQFSAWKEGTVQSIQSMTGWTPGAGSPGYWQLHALINTSWAFSKNGNQATLNVVKAIDCWTELLYQLKAQGITPPTTPPPPPPTPGPPPPPPPPPPPTSNPCDSGNPDQDEILDLCNAVNSNLTAILAAIENLNLGGGTNNDSTCCTNVVAAILSVTQQLTVIATALAFPNSGPLNIDFTPIVSAIAALAASVSADTPLLQAIAIALTTGLPSIASAISSAPGTDTTGIVDQLKQLVANQDVPDEFLRQMITDKFIPPQYSAIAQMSPGDAVHAILRFAASWSPIVGFLEHVLGDDADAVAGARDNAARVNAWLSGGIKALKGFGPATDPHTTGQLGALLKQYVKTTDDALMPVVKPILETLTGQLKPRLQPQIGNINVDQDAPIATSVGVSASAAVAAWLLSFAGIDEGESLTHMAELISGLVGLEELRDVQIGPLITHGIGQIAHMQAKKLFGQELPGAGALAGLASRGLITNPQYFTWVPYTGLPGELWEQTREAAYRGLNARQMLRLIETGLYSQAEINDELTFSGMRPLSQQRMLRAAPYLATNTERNALRSSLEKAYIAGLMDDPTLADNIDSIEQNVDRGNLVLQRVKWEVLTQESKDLETEYTTMFVGGLIDDPTFRSFLGGIGLQPWKVNTVAGKAEARANATLHRKEIAAAAALQRATATVERQAALKNFEQGTLPLPLYVAALIETGLTPTQAAAWGDLAALKKEGNIRWLYGLQLTPDAATVLKQRVSALTDQRKRQLISQQQYVQALGQLGISDTWINALDAAAEAMLTPKLSAFAVPVQT